MKKMEFSEALESRKESNDLELKPTSNEIEASEAMIENDMKQPFLKCRYVVAFVGFWCFFLATTVRLNTSVNIVAMVNQSGIAQRARVKSDSCPHLLPNATQTDNAAKEDGEFLWSPELQGYILGSYNLGYIMSQIPTGRLADKYGCKWFLVASALVTAAATFLMPVFAWISAEAFIVLQLVRGFAQGILPPAASVLVCNWFTRSERGQMFAIMHSGASIGCIVGSLLSGFLCASVGKWPSSFYTTGAIGVLVSISTIFFVYESPKVHPRISKAEQNFILKDQEGRTMKKRPNPPWRKIFTSVPMYAMFYASFGQGWSYSQFVIVHTIFLGTILHYPIAMNGVFTSLTFLLQFVCIQVATYLSSLMIKKKIASITFTRKLWTFVSCLGFSVCLLGIYFSGCNRSLSVVFGILSTGFSGVAYAGSIVTIPEMSPTFAGILHGICVAISFVAGIIVPLIVGFLTDEKQTIEQWNKIFFMGIGVVMSSAIVYCIFGSADVQPWNSVQEETKKEDTETKAQFLSSK